MVLNYLLVADFKEFGKNTGKAVTVEIDANNPEVCLPDPLAGVDGRITSGPLFHRNPRFFPAPPLAG